MLVTEPSERLEEIVDAAVAGGVNVVQLRDKAATEKELFATATRLQSITQGRAWLIVNGSAEAARDAGADGVHLPEQGQSIAETRAVLGDGALIGRSVHSVEAAVAAQRDGLDYLVAGTIFESRSHPGDPPAGLRFLADVCRAVSMPVLAIGGVKPANVGECLSAGAAGVAVLSPIMRAEDPAAVAREYRLALDEAVETVRLQA